MNAQTEILLIKNLTNPKYQRFADEYLKSGNASHAAREAGYSHRTAGVQGAGLLKRTDIAEYIAARRAQQAQNSMMTREEIERELAAIAKSNVQDYTRLNDDGDLEVDFSGATRDQLGAVSAVKVKKRKIYDNKGNVVGEEYTSEFRLWDKIRANEMLGKERGMFKPEEQKVVVDIADRLLNARARARGVAPLPLGQQRGEEDEGDQ